MKQKYLWLAVTADKYELPVAVEVSSYELARKLGVAQSNINMSQKHGYALRIGYKVVKIEDEEV